MFHNMQGPLSFFVCVCVCVFSQFFFPFELHISCSCLKYQVNGLFPLRVHIYFCALVYIKIIRMLVPHLVSGANDNYSTVKMVPNSLTSVLMSSRILEQMVMHNFHCFNLPNAHHVVCLWCSLLQSLDCMKIICQTLPSFTI